MWSRSSSSSMSTISRGDPSHATMVISKRRHTSMMASAKPSFVSMSWRLRLAMSVIYPDGRVASIVIVLYRTQSGRYHPHLRRQKRRLDDRESVRHMLIDLRQMPPFGVLDIPVVRP